MAKKNNKSLMLGSNSLKKNINKNWIAKKNQFTEMIYTFDLESQKLVLVFASLIALDDGMFKLYQVSAKELSELIGINVEERGYKKQLQKCIDELGDKKNHFRLKNDKGEVVFQAPAYASMEWIGEERDMIEFEFSRKLKPLFLNLKNDFFKYKYISIQPLKSKYAVRLYERAKSKHQQKNIKWQDSVEDTRHYLGVEDRLYPNFSDLIRRILLTAVNQINQNTDLHLIYEPVKIGRSYRWVNYEVRYNKRNKSKVDKKNENITLTPKTAIVKNYEHSTSFKNDPTVNLMIRNYNDQLRLGKTMVSLNEYVQQHSAELIQNSKGGLNLKWLDQLELNDPKRVDAEKREDQFQYDLQAQGVFQDVAEKIKNYSNEVEWNEIYDKIKSNEPNKEHIDYVRMTIKWFKKKYKF